MTLSSFHHVADEHGFLLNVGVQRSLVQQCGHGDGECQVDQATNEQVQLLQLGLAHLD